MLQILHLPIEANWQMFRYTGSAMFFPCVLQPSSGCTCELLSCITNKCSQYAQQQEGTAFLISPCSALNYAHSKFRIWYFFPDVCTNFSVLLNSTPDYGFLQFCLFQSIRHISTMMNTASLGNFLISRAPPPQLYHLPVLAAWAGSFPSHRNPRPYHHLVWCSLDKALPPLLKTFSTAGSKSTMQLVLTYSRMCFIFW